MPPLLATLRHRTRADFRLSIYLVFGVLAILFLLPIAFFRLSQGHTTLAALEFAVVVFVVGALFHAWRGGDLDRLGVVAAVGVVAGGCAVTAVSAVGLYWLFPIVMVTAFLVTPRAWVPLFAGVMACLLIEGDAIASTGQPLAVIAAMAVNGIFSVIFARHAGERRIQLEQLATLDALTGAQNRRALETELEIRIACFRRDGRPVALALIDLDHFKKINDDFGHDEGDRVLQDFVRVARDAVRRTDRLYRYGGEEFVLLMPDTNGPGLELALSNLCTHIRQSLRVRGEPVTVSIGCAILQEGEKRDSWVTRSDDALYRAKRSGRNCIEIDGLILPAVVQAAASLGGEGEEGTKASPAN